MRNYDNLSAISGITQAGKLYMRVFDAVDQWRRSREVSPSRSSGGIGKADVMSVTYLCWPKS